MYFVISINMLLDICFMLIEHSCSKNSNICDNRNMLKLGLDLKGLYNMIPMLLVVVYILPFFAYIPLFYGIFRKFKLTYNDFYHQLKCRFCIYLIIIETIILLRSFTYWVIMYGSGVLHLENIRLWRISIFISEILVGCIIIFISYKNL